MLSLCLDIQVLVIYLDLNQRTYINNYNYIYFQYNIFYNTWHVWSNGLSSAAPLVNTLPAYDMSAQ